MLFKNVAGQKIHVYAYDSTTGAAKTGDAAQITGYVSLDGTANAIDDTNPTEVDSTNMPGIYAFDLTQAETNCNSFALYAKSSTSNIRIEPIIGFTTGAANTLSVNTGTITNDAITAAAIAAGAIDAATFAADVDAEAAAWIWNAATASYGTAGTYGALLESGNVGGGAIVAASVTGAVGSVTGAVGSVTGNVGGNVTGSVGSVVGAVGSVTGNVGGNVTGSVGSVATGGITAASIANGAIDAATFAADVDAEIAAMVWNADTASYGTAGTYGEALEAVGASADPWLTNLPGAYSAGTAGYIIGTNLNATVSSRSSQTSVDTVDDLLDTEIAAILADTDELQKAITDGGRTDLLIDAIKAKTDLMLDAAAIRSAVGLASANLDTQLADLPTVAEFEARTIAAANYATAASVTTIDTLLDKFAPLLIGTVSGAGTASEVFVYGGVTATVVADVDGNRTSVTFS